MLERARQVVPAVEWQQADIARWQPFAPFDLIFSNAALHWLPDHERLLPALAGCLAPGGVLAVQMPRNFDAPSHTAIAETVRDG
jgi:trans-aconitate 2-methyltransferase